MKRFVYACVSLAALAAMLEPGRAADLGRRYQPVPAPAPIYVPIYNWSGFYLGVNGGGAFGTSRWDSIGGNVDVSGGLVGGTIGYNWQLGQFVLGLEGDADWAAISGKNTSLGCPFGCKVENNWLATVRGRVGYAFDRFLPYVTGGVAFGDIKARTPGFVGASHTETGWAVGGGLEFAIFANWTAKAEYLYVDLGKFNCGFGCGPFAPNNVSFKTNVVRAGLNYRF